MFSKNLMTRCQVSSGYRISRIHFLSRLPLVLWTLETHPFRTTPTRPASKSSTWWRSEYCSTNIDYINHYINVNYQYSPYTYIFLYVIYIYIYTYSIHNSTTIRKSLVPHVSWNHRMPMAKARLIRLGHPHQGQASHLGIPEVRRQQIWWLHVISENNKCVLRYCIWVSVQYLSVQLRLCLKLWTNMTITRSRAWHDYVFSLQKIVNWQLTLSAAPSCSPRKCQNNMSKTSSGREMP